VRASFGMDEKLINLLLFSCAACCCCCCCCGCALSRLPRLFAVLPIASHGHYVSHLMPPISGVVLCRPFGLQQSVCVLPLLVLSLSGGSRTHPPASPVAFVRDSHLSRAWAYVATSRCFPPLRPTCVVCVLCCYM